MERPAGLDGSGVIEVAKLTEFKEVRHVSELNYPGDPPMELGVLYVVDNSPYVQYSCPCGCGRDVTLPTTKHQDGYYGWGFTESEGGVTLSPSIFSTGFPCRSHYFIQKSRIKWV